MGIGKDSEDALAITKWKLPGQVLYSPNKGSNSFRQKQQVISVVDVLVKSSSLSFSDFLKEILSKRPFRDEFGEMTIDDVNNLLDRLSAASKEYPSLFFGLTRF